MPLFPGLSCPHLELGQVLGILLQNVGQYFLGDPLVAHQRMDRQGLQCRGIISSYCSIYGQLLVSLHYLQQTSDLRGKGLAWCKRMRPIGFDDTVDLNGDITRKIRNNP